ncbi:hypothetical protein AC249_AIPGENE9634 [Exaiptasia diaphana]|nr:hypothetical protein AC249_AIPGENE9634 [Exaiptasia diaphana]
MKNLAILLSVAFMISVSIKETEAMTGQWTHKTGRGIKKAFRSFDREGKAAQQMDGELRGFRPHYRAFSKQDDEEDTY